MKSAEEYNLERRQAGRPGLSSTTPVLRSGAHTRSFPTLREMKAHLRGAVASFSNHHYRRTLGQTEKTNPRLRKDIGALISKMNRLIKARIKAKEDPLMDFDDNVSKYLIEYNPAQKAKSRSKSKTAMLHCRNAPENRRIASLIGKRAAKEYSQRYMDYECGDVVGAYEDYTPPKQAYRSLARQYHFKPTVQEMHDEFDRADNASGRQVKRDQSVRTKRADRRRRMQKRSPHILEARPEYLEEY